MKNNQKKPKIIFTSNKNNVRNSSKSFTSKNKIHSQDKIRNKIKKKEVSLNSKPSPNSGLTNIILVLNKQNIDLSKYESICLLAPKKTIVNDRFLVCIGIDENKLNNLENSAYIKSAHKIIFSCGHNNLKKTLKKHDWNKIVNKTFRVRLHSQKNQTNNINELEIADIIFLSMRNPQVDMVKANTKIDFFDLLQKTYCALQIYENNNTYEKRKPKNRTGSLPISLDPRLARAMINLSKAQSICDPFCGTGGIIIEAAMMNKKAIGSDIDGKMIELTRSSLKELKLGSKKIKLLKMDATRIKLECEAIVTDPPYGLNTKTTGKVEVLYADFLMNSKNITKKIVISFPDFIKYDAIIKKTGWKKIEEFSIYIHKSLTKKIVVLE